MKLMNALNRETAFMLRERSVILTLVLVLCLSTVSVVGGLLEVERQLTDIEQLKAADQEDRSSVLSEQETWGGAAYYSFHLTYDSPAPFAFAAMGQRDTQPWKHRIRMLALEGQIYERDANNPVFGLIGRFDYSFFASFVLPFIMIVLLHDLRSSERREGRFYLLIATAGASKSLWFIRAAVRSLSVYLVAIIPLVLASFIHEVNFGLILKACFFLALYVLFWTLVSYWFTSWNKSSSVILASLIGFWSLVAIIVPTGGRLAIDQMVPLPSGQEILMLQRESVNDAWDLPKEETMQVFLERHPEWADHAKIERPFEWKWYYAFQQVGDLKTEKLSQAYRQGRLKRDRLASYLAVLTPPALLERSLQELAQTDIKSNVSYEEDVRRFHAELRQYYYPKLFRDQTFDPELLNELPNFSPDSG